MVGVPHSTRRKNEGKNLGRKHLELSERRRAFVRKKRWGKRAERKDVIGLQETKKNGIPKFRHLDTASFSVVIAGQHGIVKKEIVKKADEDGITIECISARLLKTQISIESNFVTFVVAYAPTEEASEGQKTKYITTLLDCTAASVPARENIFVLTNPNARTGK